MRPAARVMAERAEGRKLFNALIVAITGRGSVHPIVRYI